MDTTSQSVTSTHHNHVVAPVLPEERIREIDVLRGFALSGILFTHILNYNDSGHWASPIDQAALWFTGLFVYDSFLNMFSFLFGLSFAIQSERVERNALALSPLYTRRLGVLLVIGILHSLCILSDVLFKYAVLGFILLLCRKWPSRTFLIAACCCLLLLVAAENTINERLATALFGWLRSVGMGSGAEWFQAWTHGSFWDVVVANAQVFVWKGFVFPIEYLMIAKALLLGFYVGRIGLFQNLQQHLSLVRKLFWWSLALSFLGIAGSVAAVTHVFTEPQMPVFLESVPTWRGWWWLIHPALFLFYMSSVILLLQRESWARFLSPLGMYGRMALTNYLMQTLILTTTVYGCGLGLAGRIAPSRGIGFVVAVVGMQIGLSVCWLRRFRFGPVEWVWRSLTYWKPQPMLIAAATA